MMPRKVRRCLICKKEVDHLFRMPRNDPKIREKWMRYAVDENACPTMSSRFCPAHFYKDDVSEIYGRLYLHPHAVPVLGNNLDVSSLKNCLMKKLNSQGESETNTVVNTSNNRISETNYSISKNNKILSKTEKESVKSCLMKSFSLQCDDRASISNNYKSAHSEPASTSNKYKNAHDDQASIQECIKICMIKSLNLQCEDRASISNKYKNARDDRVIVSNKYKSAHNDRVIVSNKYKSARNDRASISNNNNYRIAKKADVSRANSDLGIMVKNSPKLVKEHLRNRLMKKLNPQKETKVVGRMNDSTVSKNSSPVYGKQQMKNTPKLVKEHLRNSLMKKLNPQNETPTSLIISSINTKVCKETKVVGRMNNSTLSKNSSLAYGKQQMKNTPKLVKEHLRNSLMKKLNPQNETPTSLIISSINKETKVVGGMNNSTLFKNSPSVYGKEQVKNLLKKKLNSNWEAKMTGSLSSNKKVGEGQNAEAKSPSTSRSRNASSKKLLKLQKAATPCECKKLRKVVEVLTRENNILKEKLRLQSHQKKKKSVKPESVIFENAVFIKCEPEINIILDNYENNAEEYTD